MSLYSYATTNSNLIKELNLQRHPEGGYFVETDRWNEPIPSPFANGAERPLATVIYYLLTPDEPSGHIHRNASYTMHVLHQGRATYTLIHPPSPDSPSGTAPRIERVTMGTDTSRGETRQLFVGTNVWKMSEIPREDLEHSGDKENVGCLITEVVAPGFVWEDHGFLTREGLEELFTGSDRDERIKEFEPHLRKD